MRVPDEISLMGFDNLEWSAVSVPDITSIQLPAAAMGVAAADALVDWLRTGESAVPLSLRADFLECASIGAVRPQVD